MQASPQPGTLDYRRVLPVSLALACTHTSLSETFPPQVRDDGVDSRASALIDIMLEMAFASTRLAALQQKVASSLLLFMTLEPRVE